LCFALALWNGKDPIIKERLFGLTNSEGNHGEDVKEYYFYLDSTPTHSYMKYLYKYPQSAYPYTDLVEINRRRGRQYFEYELLDTGVFDQDRYFDVFVEYAKAAPEDILVEISVFNRGPEPATLHVLPTVWFRNTWSWGEGVLRPQGISMNLDPKLDLDNCKFLSRDELALMEHANKTPPILRQIAAGDGGCVIGGSHAELGDRFLYCEGGPFLLFTENETNTMRLVGSQSDSICQGRDQRLYRAWPQRCG
jgi:hypothetical protein